MGFEFAETMSGTLELDKQPGVKHPIEFQLRAFAPSTREHLRDGHASVNGVLKAPPLAESADLDGTLLIRPLGQRIIRYELSFVGDDGERYELVGQKDIRWRNAIKTLTTLPMEVLDEQHRRIATCVTRFDYRNDLWSFLRSFRPA